MQSFAAGQSSRAHEQPRANALPNVPVSFGKTDLDKAACIANFDGLAAAQSSGIAH
jgi:hypothetical protein